MTTPSISVVIPTWNRASSQIAAVESVLAQTLLPLEIIVVDDGSSDGTLARLTAIQNHRLRLISAPHRGVSAARNVGIERARGDWLAFLDSDDTWLPQKLEAQVGALQSAPEMLLCHCDEIWIRDGRRVNPRRVHQKYGGWIFHHCLPRCAISPSSVLMHRRLFDAVGVFDESLPACEDYDLWLRICWRFPVLYLDQKWVKKTGGHADQLSRTVALDRYRIQALVKILEQGVLAGEEQRAALGTLQEKIRVYRAGVIKRGRVDEALALQELSQRFSSPG